MQVYPKNYKKLQSLFLDTQMQIIQTSLSFS